MSDSYTGDFEEVLQAERERIAAQRSTRGVKEQSTVGLALSGGGIRSSSFALGVLQAFDARDLLRRVDYLSTVSGGGYTGAALTWFRRDGELRFPFGVRGLGIRRSSSQVPSQVLGFLRQHRDQLTPAGGADAGADTGSEAPEGVPPIAYAGLVARAVFLSTFVYGSLLVGLFFALEILDRFVDLLEPVLAAIYPTPTWISIVANLNAALLAAFALLAFLAVAWIAHPFAAYVMRRWRSQRPSDDRETNRTYRVGLWAQHWTGRVLGAALVAGTLGSVPIVVDRAMQSQWLPDHSALGAAAIASIVAGALLGFSIFRKDRQARTRPTTSRFESARNRMRDVSAAVLMLYGLLVLSHVAALGLLNSGVVIASLVVLAVGVVIALLANLNQLNISRMYRDRLMEAFLPGERAISRNQWLPAFEANVATLESMCGPETQGPYHLINTNLVTVGSRRTRFRNRGGDSFTLSPLYSGSDATGWRSTRNWMQGRLTLATAMAVSGPTAQPAAGVSDRGPLRNRVVSAAMFALGLRLGFWARNPGPEHHGHEDAAPNYLDPGLLRGVFGAGRHERGRFIELSDGGTFDDLGIYELLRRRVDVIVAADASADAGFTLDALSNAVVRARVDFGVEIDFSGSGFGLEDLGARPEDEALASGMPAVAKRGFAVATIRYADQAGQLEKWGVLLYLKATLVPGLPPDVLGYKLRHADFPHEASPERLFSEEQFEAYRELGFRITKKLLKENKGRSKETTRIDPKSGVRHGPWL